MGGRRAFTLIEIMIVVVIIAILLAIAVPAFLRAQRASNERSASSSLKTIGTAEADFRTNDRDRNGIADYWTGDVSGLFGAIPVAGGTQAVKLIDISVAAADAIPVPAFAASPTAYGKVDVTATLPVSAKAAYWFYSLVTNGAESPPAPFAVDTDNTGRLVHNTATFGFGCFPDAFQQGRHVFVMTNTYTLFKRTCIANVNPTGGGFPNGRPLDSGVANGATVSLSNWPADAELAANYSKLD